MLANVNDKYLCDIKEICKKRKCCDRCKIRELNNYYASLSDVDLNVLYVQLRTMLDGKDWGFTSEVKNAGLNMFNLIIAILLGVISLLAGSQMSIMSMAVDTDMEIFNQGVQGYISSANSMWIVFFAMFVAVLFYGGYSFLQVFENKNKKVFVFAFTVLEQFMDKSKNSV